VKEPFRCECGMRTYEPFYIGNIWMCAICAEKRKPSAVAAKARLWFQGEQGKSWLTKVMERPLDG
jgi:uracil-DNA glycosylase